MLRTLTVFLSLFSLFVTQVSAQSPITARVLMTPTSSLDPVSLPRDDKAARDLAENLFVGLTRQNPDNGAIEPMLAREWQTSPDGLTWTFKLRSDVQWVRFNAASGQVEAVRPVVAGDFVYGIRRACDPQLPNPAAHSVFIIAGCSTIAKANPQIVNDLFIARQLGVRATGQQTLEISLAFPAVYFPTLLALPEFRPVPREAIAKDPDWTKPDTIITNGPFALKSWDRANSAELIRNPLWLDALTGNVTNIAVAFSKDTNTFTNADFARIDPTAAQTLKDAGLTVQSVPRSVTILGFSAERTITQTDAVRRALALSINRDALIKALPAGSVMTTSFLLPTNAPDNRGYMPDAAKAALTASSIPGCNRLPEKFDLAIDTSPASVILAQTLIEGWKTTLGCLTTVFNIRKVSDTTLQDIANATVNVDESQNGTPRPQLWIATWTPDYDDPNAWVADALHCQYGYLHANVACGNADTLVDQAGREPDAAKRADAYKQAEAIWFGPNGTYPVVPLYTTLEAHAYASWLTGIANHGALRFDLWKIDAAKQPHN